jgi:DNA-binding MarR family transcriptional regulator
MNKKELLKILMNPVDAAGKVVELTNKQTKEKERIIKELLKKNKK